ncbi:TolC family protein [Arenibacter sp. 6A1]|uniref:TolC family protein n=1 Tax=Arenibacter sp. 6A1 TaxID=2720391 RepID=UPI001445B185|nr:TolC family protein [Arenibacter sp. 6A1]NKI27850.1 TolC family protein [Arenibacter sp. 6A1]
MVKQIMAITGLWLTVAVMFPLYGQQQNEHTLGTLWPKVVAYYPGIGVKNSAIDVAKLQERAVKSEMLPQIKAQAQNTYGTYRGNAGAFFPQMGTFNVNAATSNMGESAIAANSYGSTTVEWEVFSFGKLRKQSEASKAQYQKKVSEKEAYLLSLKKIVSERYISLLYNAAKLRWSEKNTERLDDIRKITSGLSAAGLRPAADSLLASSSFMQSKGERDKWKGYKKASSIKLLELFGGDSINYAASAARFSEGSAQHYLNQENTINPTHPVLDMLEKQSQYYRLSGQSQKRASLPSLRLMGGYAYRGTGINSDGTVSDSWSDGFSNKTHNYLAGIGLTWNISSLHTSRLKGAGLFKEAEGADLLQEQYGQAMQADLTASQAKLVQQFEQLQKTSIAVKQSQEAYAMYLARYKSGLITLSELLQIRLLLEQTENNHVEASRDYWMLLAYEAELTADFDFLFNNL